MDCKIIWSDLAIEDYGFTTTKVKSIAKKLHAKAQKARRAGRSKVFKGNIEVLLVD